MSSPVFILLGANYWYLAPSAEYYSCGSGLVSNDLSIVFSQPRQQFLHFKFKTDHYSVCIGLLNKFILIIVRVQIPNSLYFLLSLPLPSFHRLTFYLFFPSPQSPFPIHLPPFSPFPSPSLYSMIPFLIAIISLTFPLSSSPCSPFPLKQDYNHNFQIFEFLPGCRLMLDLSIF